MVDRNTVLIIQSIASMILAIGLGLTAIIFAVSGRGWWETNVAFVATFGWMFAAKWRLDAVKKHRRH